MSDPTARETTAAELADAEQNVREILLLDGIAGLDVVMAEYDRRGAVERTAATYVMAGLCGNDQADQSAKLAALIEAVRTNRNFHG